MNGQIRILFVDDEPPYRRIFSKRIGNDPRFIVDTAASGHEALAKLKISPADIIFTDLKMPLMDGIQLTTEIKKIYPHSFVLLLTGDDATSLVVQAMKAGAYDYLLKPLDFEMINHAIETILHHKEAQMAGYSCQDGRFICFESLIGQDRKMFEIYEKISQVAQTHATVLITGESGTGKELIAEAIHNKSLRSGKPFVQVNCAALTEGLINSELFGHEKGAFTGAVSRKKGLFEQACGGTLFLDEIGDISPTTQVSLLRILELGSFQRVGGQETIKADVRLVCATNKNLQQAIQDKLFREDLYYRLNVVSLHAPPLRERKSDIPLLANYFLERFSKLNNRQVATVSQKAMETLCRYSWPGNCRELANVMEHAVVFSKGGEIDEALLPRQLLEADSEIPARKTTFPVTSLAQAEKMLICSVLESTDWNLKKAAEQLDIARGTLYSKIEKYGICKPSEQGAEN